MALQLNPDGTFSVIDDATGAATLSNLPGEFAPPQARPMGTEAKIAGALGVAPPSTPGVTPVAQPPGVDPSQIVRPGSASSTAPGVAPGAPAGGEPGSAAGSATQQALMSAIRGSPVAYVDRPETRQVVAESIEQGQQPLSAETQSALETARANRAIAADVNAAATRQQQGEAASALAEQQDDADARLAELRDEQRQIQEQAKRPIAALEQLSQQMAKSREEAQKYWADKKEGTSFLAGIGLLLSDFGSMALGQANPVRAEIARREEQELALQKAELETLGAEAEGQTNLLAQMRAQFLSPEAADLAARSLLKDRNAAKVLELDAKTVGVNAANAARATAADLQAEAAELRKQAEIAEQDTIRQQVKVNPAFKGRVGGSRGGIEAAFALGKKLGLNAEQTMSLLDKGMLPGFAKGDLQRIKAENDLLEEQRRGATLRGEAPPMPKGENTQKVRGAAAVALQGIDRYKQLSEAEGYAPSRVLPGGLYQGSPALTSEAKALASTAAMIAEGGTAPNADVMRGLEQQLTHWDPDVRRAAVETIEKNIKAALVQAGGKAPVERGRPAP